MKRLPLYCFVLLCIALYCVSVCCLHFYHIAAMKLARILYRLDREPSIQITSYGGKASGDNSTQSQTRSYFICSSSTADSFVYSMLQYQRCCCRCHCHYHLLSCFSNAPGTTNTINTTNTTNTVTMQILAIPCSERLQTVASHIYI